ncbi:MAG: hypothetical protein GTO29_10630, partial [Candidatus Latescibacteria bacterium]|nr:hypothetical protein [Candidatus Latescibacterota bacterium]
MVLFSPGSYAKTWYVKPDGTGDAPTIQAGIDSAAVADTVLLANGTFTGMGNRDIDFNGKAITVRSESGDPNLCIIDCQEAGRGFYFHSGEWYGSVIDGVTITNGSAQAGGGIFVAYHWPAGISPTVTNCTFYDNRVELYGGAIYCDNSRIALTNCTFYFNWSDADGGGICCVSSTPTLTNCTFHNNIANHGAGMYSEWSTPIISNCTYVANLAGG